VALLFLPFLRDRRSWLALALLGTAIPLVLLPGRIFTVYLYLPLTGAAIGLAVVFQKIPRTIYLPALALWLAWSYSSLRHFRRAELSEARVRSRYVTQLLASGDVIRGRTRFFTDGKPAALETWGIAGAVRQAGGAHGLEVARLELNAGWRERMPVEPFVLSWDDPKQRLVSAPLPPPAELLPALDLTQPAALPQLLEGFEPLHDEYRPILHKARIALAAAPGARQLELDWRVDEVTAPDVLIVWVNGERLADLHCYRPGVSKSSLPVRIGRGSPTVVDLGAAPGVRVSLRSIAVK
jgi:hypothetical protein